MSQSSDDRNYIKLMSSVFKLFRWSGHWFPYSNHKSHFVYCFDIYRSFICITTILMHITFCIIDFILKISDTTKMLTIMLTVIYLINTIFRVTFTIVKGKNLWKIFQDFNKDYVPPTFYFIDPKLGQNVIPESIKSSKKFILINIIAANVTVFLSIFAPFLISEEGDFQATQLLVNNSKPLLIFDTWYPLDISIAPIYQLTLLFQAVCTVIWINMNAIADAVYISVIIRSIEELNILQDMLQIISDVITLSVNGQHHDQRFQILCQQNVVNSSNDIVVELMISWIVHHQFVVSTVQEVQKVLSSFVIGFIGCNFLSLVLSAFTAVRIKDPIAVFAMMVFSILVMIQLFSFSYYSQKLTTTSEKISKKLFWIKWWDASKEFQSILKIVSLRVLRTVNISGMGFFNVNLSLFLTIIRGALSYFAVLIQLTDETTQ